MMKNYLYRDRPLVDEITRIKWLLIDFCSKDKTNRYPEIENIINNDLIDLIIFLREKK